MQSIDTDLILRAIDISHSIVVQLPQTLDLRFEYGESAPLWIAPFEKMPYGLTTVSGHVIICADGYSFNYKAWRFVDYDKLEHSAWQKAPEFLPMVLPRLKIRSTSNYGQHYSTWSAAYENCWQEKGVLSHYKLEWGVYKKTAEEDISFARFMELNYWDLFSLLDPQDPTS
jgi:hypothetical protein